MLAPKENDAKSVIPNLINTIRKLKRMYNLLEESRRDKGFGMHWVSALFSCYKLRTE